MTSLTEQDIIGTLAAQTGISKGVVGQVVGSLVGTMEDLSSQGEPIQLGNLKIQHQPSDFPESTPDEFFGETEIQRLGELMKKWRNARDNSSELPAKEQAELEKLIDLEFQASAARARAQK